MDATETMDHQEKGLSPESPTEADPMMAPDGDKQLDVVRSLRFEAPETKYNDIFFSVLFGLDVLVIAVIAFWKGIPAFKLVLDDQLESVSDKVNASIAAPVGMVVILVLVSGALTYAWLRVLIAYAESIIRIALGSIVVFSVAFGLVMLAVNPGAAILCFFPIGFVFFFIWKHRKHIPFASANLRTACAAVKIHSSLILFGIALLVLEALWFTLWGISILGIRQIFIDANPNCAGDKSDGSQQGGKECNGLLVLVAYFFMLMSAFWGEQVLENLLTCTTAGAVASWWYQPDTKRVVSRAVRRSMTTSFGSICFGSLLVAILKALEMMARKSKESAEHNENPAIACCGCISECVLSTLTAIMDYINEWAYVYVGIYGSDFRTSAKSVLGLLRNRGWNMLINDSIASSVLGFGSIGVGMITCSLGLGLALITPTSWYEVVSPGQKPYAVLGVIGFVGGAGMSSVLTQVVVAALHTIFVCFAEDPSSLKRNHPEEYGALVDGWRRFNSEGLVRAFANGV